LIIVPKKLNIDWSNLKLENPRTVKDGRNGVAIERYLKSLGYAVDQHGTIDLPQIGTYGVEVKSRSVFATVPYSIGSMTLPSIEKCDWDNTSVKRKLQIQLRVMIGEDSELNGVVVDSYILDFRHPAIQSMLRSDYEEARQNLIKHDKHGTAAGGRYGFLEQQTANSFKFRITLKGMKNLEKAISNLTNSLFSYT
jgi:hypothetical protein